jgi:hypothetical protein
MEAEMGSNEQFDDESVSIELSEAGIREMARRQLGASIAVAVVIAIGAGLFALAPAPRDVAALSARQVASVQQPQFAAPLNDRVASARHAVRELP